MSRLFPLILLTVNHLRAAGVMANDRQVRTVVPLRGAPRVVYWMSSVEISLRDGKAAALRQATVKRSASPFYTT